MCFLCKPTGMFEKHRLQRHLVHTFVSEQNLQIDSFLPSIVMASAKTFSAQDFFLGLWKPSKSILNQKNANKKAAKTTQRSKQGGVAGIATGHTTQEKQQQTHITPHRYHIDLEFFPFFFGKEEAGGPPPSSPNPNSSAASSTTSNRRKTQLRTVRINSCLTETRRREAPGPKVWQGGGNVLTLCARLATLQLVHQVCLAHTRHSASCLRCVIATRKRVAPRAFCRPSRPPSGLGTCHKKASAPLSDSRKNAHELLLHRVDKGRPICVRSLGFAPSGPILGSVHHKLPRLKESRGDDNLDCRLECNVLRDLRGGFVGATRLREATWAVGVSRGSSCLQSVFYDTAHLTREHPGSH